MSDLWSWRPQQPAYTQQPASLIRLDGADALRVLHGQTSAAIEQAGPGQWIPTCCIGPTARLQALAEVLVDGEGAWLVVSAGNGAQVHQALDRVLFPADRVRLGTVQTAWWLTPVPGQGETLPAPAEPAAPWGTWRALGERGWQLGGGPLGQALVLLDPIELPPVWHSRQLLGAQEQERWRLQQGLPTSPEELNADHNPFELGLAARVSLSKGCYVGQETLAKLATYDGVKQHLRRWHWTDGRGQQPPEPGGELRGGTADAPVRMGRITSMLELEQGDRIGLALVRRQGLSEAQLRAGDGPQAAVVEISVPEQFAAPPTGAGGQAASQAASQAVA